MLKERIEDVLLEARENRSKISDTTTKLLTAIREAAEERMQAKNPYPSDIFPMTIETAAKYVPYDKRDAVFGAWGRYVWGLATQEFIKWIGEEEKVEDDPIKEAMREQSKPKGLPKDWSGRIIKEG